MAHDVPLLADRPFSDERHARLAYRLSHQLEQLSAEARLEFEQRSHHPHVPQTPVRSGPSDAMPDTYWTYDRNAARWRPHDIHKQYRLPVLAHPTPRPASCTQIWRVEPLPRPDPSPRRVLSSASKDS